jgi:hypothetical protein
MTDVTQIRFAISIVSAKADSIWRNCALSLLKPMDFRSRN